MKGVKRKGNMLVRPFDLEDLLRASRPVSAQGTEAFFIWYFEICILTSFSRSRAAEVKMQNARVKSKSEGRTASFNPLLQDPKN